MGEQATIRRKKPVILIALFVVLLLLSLSTISGVGYGFYTGLITPYWDNLSDAHAAIFGQIIFFFGAAWAAVLVPLLFGEQLQNLQDAAERAEATYARIETRMQETATRSEGELKKIVRLQMMSVGHVLDEQLEFLQTPDERNDFVDTRWDKACAKVDEAIARLDGNRRNSIGQYQKRSNDWWDRIKHYEVLGEYHGDFRLLSDKARKFKNNLDIDDLRASNEASRRVESFDPIQQAIRPQLQSNNTSTALGTIPPSGVDGHSPQLPQ